MTASRSLFAVCLILRVAVGAPLLAADKPKDLIVGKWEPVEKKDQGLTIEFLKDGKVKITFPQANINLDGTYKFLDDSNIEIEFKVMDKVQMEKLKVEVTQDALTTTDSMNKVEKFKRVK